MAEMTPDEMAEYMQEEYEKLKEIKELLLTYVQKTEKERREVLFAAKQEAERMLQKAREDAEILAKSEERRLLREAEAEAARYRESLREEAEEEIENAKRRAEEEICAAKEEAEKIVAEAKIRAAKVRAAPHNEIFAAEQEAWQTGFSEIREALLSVGGVVKKAEDLARENATKKAFAAWHELFHLIADTKDSTRQIALQKDNPDLKTAAANMDVFLDMIGEYLADYGIEMLVSAPGTPYSAKTHAAEGRGADFDPKSAVVQKSLRPGFCWGEQVLEKEKVEVGGTRR